MPRAALGISTKVPELLPVEGYLLFGRFAALRVFYAPALPLNIKVNMPSDVIAYNKTTQLAVANPDFSITGRLTYGDHAGAEILAFPTGGSFYLAGGVSRRQIHLVASAESPVLVCSVGEAMKEPPCGDPKVAITTRTHLTAHLDSSTSALLLRGAAGWFWHVGHVGYMTFEIGATKPTDINRNVGIDVNVASPEGTNPELSKALSQVKADREADLRSQALKQLQPLDEKWLPILGLGLGVRF